jgi:hypothetical protein
VFEVDAESSVTYEDPRFNPRHPDGPRRIELHGAILNHAEYDLADQPDLLRSQDSITERPSAE